MPDQCSQPLRLSGLGAATVKHFRDLNAHVAVVDLHLPKDEQDTDRLRFFKADVSQSNQVQEATSAIVNWCKDAGLAIIAVVCCAGYLGSAKVALTPDFAIEGFC